MYLVVTRCPAFHFMYGFLVLVYLWDASQGSVGHCIVWNNSSKLRCCYSLFYALSRICDLGEYSVYYRKMASLCDISIYEFIIDSGGGVILFLNLFWSRFLQQDSLSKIPPTSMIETLACFGFWCKSSFRGGGGGGGLFQILFWPRLYCTCM